jgi:hypothetical protein
MLFFAREEVPHRPIRDLDLLSFVDLTPVRLRYNALYVGQWRFWVASREAVASAGSRSLSLATVKRIAAREVDFRGLDQAIREVGSAAPEG